MTNPTEEKAKKLKEISDLRSEIQKTEKLRQEGRADELSAYLLDLNTKYLFETGAYNILHPVPPKDLQENAQNCVSFLSSLLAERIADMGDKN